MRGFDGPPMPEDLRQSFSPKKVALILAGCGLVLLVIAGIANWFGLGRYWPWSGLDIDVSKPELKDGGPSGTFTLYHAAFTGVPSDGFGGACLIADIASKVSTEDANTYGINPNPCTSDAQCNPLHKGVFPSPQTWWGYCAPDPDNASRRCWYKPVLGEAKDCDENEKELCEKSPYYFDPKDPKSDPANLGLKAWLVGVDNPTPHHSGYDLKNFYETYTNGQAVRWRVVGLVRAKSGGELVRYGEPAEVKAQ
jgi:hypothetical protein